MSVLLQDTIFLSCCQPFFLLFSARSRQGERAIRESPLQGRECGAKVSNCMGMTDGVQKNFLKDIDKWFFSCYYGYKEETYRGAFAERIVLIQPYNLRRVMPA